MSPSKLSQSAVVALGLLASTAASAQSLASVVKEGARLDDCQGESYRVGKVVRENSKSLVHELLPAEDPYAHNFELFAGQAMPDVKFTGQIILSKRDGMAEVQITKQSLQFAHARCEHMITNIRRPYDGGLGCLDYHSVEERQIEHPCLPPGEKLSYKLQVPAQPSVVPGEGSFTIFAAKQDGKACRLRVLPENSQDRCRLALDAKASYEQILRHDGIFETLQELGNPKSEAYADQVQELQSLVDTLVRDENDMKACRGVIAKARKTDPLSVAEGADITPDQLKQMSRGIDIVKARLALFKKNPAEAARRETWDAQKRLLRIRARIEALNAEMKALGCQ